MPFKEVFVPAEVAFRYRGVKVYHVYKDNDFDQGSRDYWYGLSPECLEGGDVFDVRDVAAALGWPPPSSLSQAKRVLESAIDWTLATGNPRLCGEDFAFCWERRPAEDPDPVEYLEHLTPLLSPELYSAVLTVVEFCYTASKLDLSGTILDQMDLSDEAFREAVCLLERLLGTDDA